jgi:K+-sensing histidine kinase KdpD
VQHGGRHLLSLINDLLDLARIESGRVELHPEAFDCHALLDEVAVGLRPLAEDKGLNLEVAPVLAAIEMFCDRRAVSQILINLTNKRDQVHRARQRATRAVPAHRSRALADAICRYRYRTRHCA